MTARHLAGYAVIAFATIGVIAVLGFAIGAGPAGTAGEFVCYTRDALTERHVGVSNAIHDDHDWRLAYVDGPRGWTYYTPRPGESCRLETSP